MHGVVMEADIQNLTDTRKDNSFQVTMLIGGAVMAVLAQWVRGSAYLELRWVTYIFFVIGIIFFLFGAWTIDNNRMPQWVEKGVNGVSGWFHITPTRLLYLFFSICLVVIATLADGYEAKMLNPLATMFCWAGAIFLVIAAAWEQKLQKITISRPTLLWFLAIFLVALALRVINMTYIPVVLSGDEASSGLHTVNFLKGYTNNLFNVGWFSFPSLYFLLQSVGISILGQTTVGLRITAGIVGALTVATLYLAIRAMFGQRTALIAAAILAFSHFHINFSRIGLNNIWDGLGFVIAIGALWWGWKAERRAAFLLSGLAMGFAQYFYTTSRGIIAVVFIWLILVAIQDWKKFKRMLPNILIMFISAYIVVLPLAWFFIKHPNEFMAPMSRVTILGEWLSFNMKETGKPMWRLLYEQFSSGFLAYTDLPLRAWYTPGTPLLRRPEAVIFLLGVGLMLLKIKDNRNWLILSWLLVFAVSGALSESTPAAQRYVAAIPACAVVIGYGFNRLIELAGKIWEKRTKLITVIVLVCAMVVAVDDARFYFYDYTPRSDFGGYHGQIAQHLVNTLKSYDNSWVVIFSGWPEMGYYSISSLPYLMPSITGIDIFKPWGDPENPVIRPGKYLFVFLPVRQEDFEACKAQFPGGTVSTEYGPAPWHELLYYLYKVEVR